MRVRKKPIEVEAWSLNHKEIELCNLDWVREAWIKGDIDYYDRCWHVKTIEGIMRATDYDYLIKGAHGELYPVNYYVFNDTYDIIDEGF